MPTPETQPRRRNELAPSHASPLRLGDVGYQIVELCMTEKMRPDVPYGSSAPRQLPGATICMSVVPPTANTNPNHRDVQRWAMYGREQARQITASVEVLIRSPCRRAKQFQLGDRVRSSSRF